MKLHYEKVFKKIKKTEFIKTTGIPESTVYTWKKSGIPDWRTPQIVWFASLKGIDISECYCQRSE